MTTERKAQALTVALLAALGAFVWVRQNAPAAATAPPPTASQVRRTEPSPQDAIYAMLDAARAGDVPAYRGFYTREMEMAVAQAVAEQGDERFGRYLKEANASIKGIAISEPQIAGGLRATARVEYVYQDRNEVQVMHLERGAPGQPWKIARVENTERIRTLVPYGSPVQ